MKTFRSFIAAALGGLVVAGAAVQPGQAARFDVFDPTASVMLVASDCYAVGEEVAAQKGGTLARATQSTQNGQPVCVIVVLVPGKDGERPRRTEVVVPQG